MSLCARTFAALYDPVCLLGERRGMAARRRALLAGARGRVLEIGAGTGLNLPHLPAGVAALTLTEPAPEMARRLRTRVAERGVATEVVETGAEALPFADGSFDTVVSTLVLCTVPDPAAAVAEVRRVLAPGGALLFLEHVRAQEGSRVQRWQDRLERPWAVVGAGCRCNRDTLALLRDAFPHTHAREKRWRGAPPIVRPLVVGEARA
ncbi:MAG TPA: class I SAM-dependent methyltransferase [Solirubrobacteraceae bacterium]|nr:class I SAM-dependent methyltransferase [Solirubrobacteraceae bacterium]